MQRYALQCVREKWEGLALAPGLTRDRSKLGAWNDPGSAMQRHALRCVREK
jgi:hypothetical protein